MTNEIKNLKLNLKNMIREADKSVSTNEKLELLEEALIYCEGEDFKELKESVESKILAINESVQARAKQADVLEETVKTKETEVSAVKESVKAKEGEVSKLKAITESIKNSFNRNKLILEKQTELKEEVESKLTIVERDLDDMISKNSILESALDEALELAKVDEAEDKKMSKAEVKANFIKNVVNKGKDSDKKDDDDKESDKKDKDEEKGDSKDDKKKESVDPKIASFYEDSVKVNESLVASKEAILACKTLKEAQEFVLKEANKVEKKEVEVVHENVNSKIVETKYKSVSDITARYRENWGV